MRIHHLDLDTTTSADSTHTTPAISPGKSTLAEKIARFGRGTEPVQAHRDAPASDQARAEEQLLLISHDLPRGGGAPLPAPVQAKMSDALGADFSGVRVHEGEHAGAIGANALASGDDLHFAAGKYDPDSRAGQELIGHELAHVVQQRAGRVGATAQASGLVDNAMEQEADTLGAQAAATSASRQVAGDGGYIYEQLADGTITIVAGPKNVGKTYQPADPINKAITAEIGAFPQAAPAPAADAPAPAPVEEGTGIPSLDEILSGIGEAVGGVVDGVTGAIGGVVDGITGAIGGLFGSTPAEPQPGEPAPIEEAPAADGPHQMVVPPGGRLYKAAGDTKSVKTASAVTPVEILETVILDATVTTGDTKEAGKCEWMHVKSADGAIDHWVKFGGLTRDDEFAAELAPSTKIPTDGLEGVELEVATIWNQKGAYIDSARGALERAIAVAVMKVESKGFAFTMTGEAVARFEVHKFFKNKEGLTVSWGEDNAATFDNHFRPRSGATSHEMNVEGADSGGTWAPFHGSQSLELAAIDLAASLSDRETALRCASFGAGQVMGFNAAALGYASATEMVDAMNADVKANAGGVFDFIATKPDAQAALAKEDYVGFATVYNGKGPWVATYGAWIEEGVTAFRALEATHLKEQPQLPDGSRVAP